MLDQRENIDKKKEAKDNSFFIRDLFAAIAHGWYWYVISLLLCMTAAWFTVQSTPNRYQMQSLLQINTPATNMDKALNMSDINNTVSQELYVIKSSILIKEVVKRLELCARYQTEGTFQNGDWYTSSPVKLTMLDGIYPDVAIRIHLDKDSYKLSFDGKQLKGSYGKVMDTELGRIKVNKTKYFDTFKYDDMLITLSNIESTTDRYAGEVGISVYDEKAGIISIKVTDNVEGRAKDIANTLLSVYDNYCIEYNNRMAQNASDFIKERLKFISQDLSSIDENIASYKSRHNFVSIESQTGMALSSRNEYNNELTEVNGLLQQTNMLMPMVSATGTEYKLLPTNLVQDPALQTLIGQYNQLVQNRMMYVEKSSEHGPVVLELNSQIDALKTTIIQSIENYRTGLKIKADNLRKLMARSSSLISSVPEGEKDIQSISRQQKIKEELYLSLLSKREENAISLAMKESYTRVIEYAKGGKVFPQPSQLYMIAFILGLVIPSVLIFMSRMLDVKIHSRRDITNYTNIPVAGIIPTRKVYKNEENTRKSNEQTEEAFRFLSSNIPYLLGSKDKKVIMLTSTYSGDGKSFISENLARSLAMVGRKVLLINADMRKRESFFGKHVKYERGLSTWLASDQTTTDGLISHDFEGGLFDVIHNGPLPPNASTLLSNKRFEILVNAVRKDYDYVLIDAVPFGIVADAFIIHDAADLVFYVINERTSDRRIIDDMESIMAEGKLSNLCFVMNGYKSVSYNGYGYGYGYGEYGSRPKTVSDKVISALSRLISAVKNR